MQLDSELLFVFMLRTSPELLQDYNPTALNSTYYEDCRLYLEYILGHNATCCIFSVHKFHNKINKNCRIDKFAINFK